MMRALPLILTLVTGPAWAGVVEGQSSDPLGELNTLYAGICDWEDGTTIPYEVVTLTDDGIDDYLLSYDLSCRGQANAFAGTHGMARQLWVSTAAGAYERILDINAKDLRIERREDRIFVVLEQTGTFCMTAEAAPCFVTLELTDTELVLAPRAQQHPSMTARLDAMDASRQETEND